MSDERRPEAPPETPTKVSTRMVAPTSDTVPILCPVNAIYCSTFGIEQLLAFGKAKACCRSYWDTDEVSS